MVFDMPLLTATSLVSPFYPYMISIKHPLNACYSALYALLLTFSELRMTQHLCHVPGSKY